MSYRGVLFALIVVFAVFFVLVFENPLFLAKFNNPLSTETGSVAITPLIPSAPTPPWPTTGFAYACGVAGLGALQVTNSGQSTVSVVSVTLTYGGETYEATDPTCPVSPGTTFLSITALGAFPGAGGSSFSGSVTTASGMRIGFTGTWS